MSARVISTKERSDIVVIRQSLSGDWYGTWYLGHNKLGCNPFTEPGFETEEKCVQYWEKKYEAGSLKESAG